MSKFSRKSAIIQPDSFPGRASSWPRQELQQQPDGPEASPGRQSAHVFDTQEAEEEEEEATCSSVWWSQQNWEDFCRTTSMHGWFFLVDTSLGSNCYAVLCRVFWIMVVLASMTMSIVLVAFAYEDYSRTSVVASYDPGAERKSWHNVSFPSLTVCNVNQGRKSFFKSYNLFPENYTDQDAKLGSLFDAIYRGMDHVPTPEEESLTDMFLNDAELNKEGNRAFDMYHHWPTIRDTMRAPDTKELDPSLDFLRLAARQKIGQSTILRISFHGTYKAVDEFAIFHPFFDTDFGYCTYIRPDIMFDTSNKSFHDLLREKEAHHDEDHGEEIRLGTEHGLQILLDAETFDYGYSPSSSEGFRIAIQHNFDFPIAQFSPVDISPGYNSRLAVKPTLTLTTPVAIDRFAPPERKCLLNNDVKFVHLVDNNIRYSYGNCVLEATFAKVAKECKCQRGVGELNTRHVHGEEAGGDEGEDKRTGWPTCYKQDLACYYSHFKNLGQIENITDRDGNVKNCLAACFDQSYEVSLTQSTFPNWSSIMTNRRFFCLVYRKVRAICNDTFRREAFEEKYDKFICREICDEVNHTCTDKDPMVVEEIHQEFITDPMHSNFTIECKANAAGHGDGFVPSHFPPLQHAIYRYARDNLVLLNVFIKDTDVTRIEIGEKQPRIWFWANVGGLLGLAMGSSIVTLFEIIYYCSNWCLYVRARMVDERKKQN